LAASEGIGAPRTLAQEVTYAITTNRDEYDGVTSYVASERKEVRVNSWKQLVDEYEFCWKGRMDTIQWAADAEHRMRNLFALPVVLGDEVFGVLRVENTLSQAPFSDSDVTTMRGMASEVALLAKTQELLNAHESKLIEAPARLVGALVRSFEPDPLTEEIVKSTAQELDAEICSLWVVDPTGRFLVPKAYHGFRAPGEVPRYRVDIYPEEDREIEGITAWVGIRKKPFFVNTHDELRNHPSWRGKWDGEMWGGSKAAKSKFHSMYAVPLMWQEQLLGVLKIENPQSKDAFSPADRTRFDLLANYVVLLLAITTQLRVQLVPDIAHILNTPAASLAMMLQQLEREVKRETPSLDRLNLYIDLVKKETLTIVTMSRTLSAEVAARAGFQEREPIQLNELLNRTTNRIQPLAPADIRIERQPDTQSLVLPLTRSERTWFEIVMFNLLHNAFKWSGDDSTIRVICESSPDGNSIHVIDQGDGISPEDLEHIFEPGFRKEVGGWAQGMGLGLYTVQRLLRQMGWTCHAGNEPGAGAKFTITIPPNWRNAHAR
jgi:signal transduction histidine kinase